MKEDLITFHFLYSGVLSPRRTGVPSAGSPHPAACICLHAFVAFETKWVCFPCHLLLGINYSPEQYTHLCNNQPGNWGTLQAEYGDPTEAGRPWLQQLSKAEEKRGSPSEVEMNQKCWPVRWVYFSVSVFPSEWKVKEQSPAAPPPARFWNEAIGLPYLTRWIKCGEKITEFNQHSHSVHVVGNNQSKKHLEN